MQRCHPLEGGDPGNISLLDSRLRGNDREVKRERQKKEAEIQ
ncbi:MAG: hypothetical protein SFT93_00425 [Rickettsiaceae bacterium]|nr:hypothetical protein [Rickettsiaceae bacterium]